MFEKKTEPSSLKDILMELLEAGVLPFRPDDMRIWQVWKDVVGRTIAEHAQPVRIRKRRLHVRVSDPIWFQELNYMENDIRDRINLTLGRRAIDKIEFSVGECLPDD